MALPHRNRSYLYAPPSTAAGVCTPYLSVPIGLKCAVAVTRAFPIDPATPQPLHCTLRRGTKSSHTQNNNLSWPLRQTLSDSSSTATLYLSTYLPSPTGPRPSFFRQHFLHSPHPLEELAQHVDQLSQGRGGHHPAMARNQGLRATGAPPRCAAAAVRLFATNPC
jgi:hypothetical protein